MAVILLRVIQRWIGLSTDTKPTGVPVMSQFYEYNTRNTYISHDGTNWTKYS